MNKEEYISSGILEGYLLGELSEKECAEIEGALVQYPELRTEFFYLEEAQEKLLTQASIHPKAIVKEKLLEKIERQRVLKVVSIAPKMPVNYWQYAAAASILLALFSSFMAYNYWNQLRIAETNLNEYIVLNQRMAQDYNNVNNRLDKIENDLEVIDNPAFKRVTMKGTDNAPGAIAFVFWNADTQELFLKVQNMKRLAQDNQYQLWAIVEGKPVDAGVFNAQSEGLTKMKQIAGAAAFAVTIEPYGGKQNPSLETMQVIGNVEKS